MISTVDSLLQKRGVSRFGVAGDKALARSRMQASRFLAEHFAAYDSLRAHLFHPEHFPVYEASPEGREVTRQLVELGWIEPSGAQTWALGHDIKIRSYLAGGWLEEYVFLAHEAAGSDEVYFAQQVEWKVGNVIGKNEIDVIARRGDILSFTSCKAIQADKTQAHMAQLRGFITETDYWNIHFANDQGRALLVVTADFIDELSRNSLRYPQLMARASILNVTVASLESLSWSKIVEAIKAHW